MTLALVYFSKLVFSSPHALCTGRRHLGEVGTYPTPWRAAAPELRRPDPETPKHVRYMSGHLFSVPMKPLLRYKFDMEASLHSVSTYAVTQ